jgi:uncharacterized membrane protein
MDPRNDFDHRHEPEAALFAAQLTPHRSLGRRGFLVLMSIITVVSFAAGLRFAQMGAWPVLGFFVLDVAAIYGAFRLNYRHAAAREDIVVTPSEVWVRRISHRGQISEWTFNPLWVRLEQTVHAEFGVERLQLVSSGRRLAIASFLGPDEKASFAKALLAALAAAKRGPTRSFLA